MKEDKILERVRPVATVAMILGPLIQRQPNRQDDATKVREDIRRRFEQMPFQNAWSHGGINE